MKTPADSGAPRPPLPPASHEMKGCLFLPGCMGGFIFWVLLIVSVVYVVALTYALITGVPLPAFPIKFSTPYECFKAVLLIVSWFTYRFLCNRQGAPWLYWLVIFCGLGWLVLIWTGGMDRTPSDLDSITFKIIISIPLLNFVISRKNRIYHGITRPWS
jgi:hypothetical protein